MCISTVTSYSAFSLQVPSAPCFKKKRKKETPLKCILTYHKAQVYLFQQMMTEIHLAASASGSGIVFFELQLNCAGSHGTLCIEGRHH